MRIWFPSSDWLGQVSAHWLRGNFKNYFIEICSAATQCRRLGSSVCDFSLIYSVPERPLSAMAGRLWLWLEAQLTRKNPLWQIYFFSGFIRLRAISWERQGRTEGGYKGHRAMLEEYIVHYKAIQYCWPGQSLLGSWFVSTVLLPELFTLVLLRFLWNTFL